MKEEFVEYADFLGNLKDTGQRSPIDDGIFRETYGSQALRTRRMK